MALSDEQINKIIDGLDFVTCQEDLKISTEESAMFWDWFKLNASLLVPEDLDKFELIDYRGRCFDIAQKVYKNTHKKYYEGFLMLQYNTVYHGFNFSSDKVEDYTVKKNPAQFKEMNGNKLPSEYYGINIPDDFIEKENGSFLIGDQINIPSLLYKFYINIK